MFKNKRKKKTNLNSKWCFRPWNSPGTPVQHQDVDIQGWEYILPQISLWRSPAGCTVKLKTNTAAVPRAGRKDAETAESPGCPVKG